MLRFNESNNLNMTCIVDSFPVRDSYWNVSNILSNNIILRDDMSNSLAIESLFISRLKRSDNGTYYCCANDTTTPCLSVDVIVQSNLNLKYDKIYFSRYILFLNRQTIETNYYKCYVFTKKRGNNY